MKRSIAFLRLLFDIRKGWKSKQVIFARLLAYLSLLDITFFQGGLGGNIVAWIVLGLAQVGVPASEAQVAGFLMFIVSTIVLKLRQITTQPLEVKIAPEMPNYLPDDKKPAIEKAKHLYGDPDKKML